VPRNRSGASVVQSPLDIKRWRQSLPAVAEARPARCLACGAASCPVGGAIRLHGHGTRERQIRGPAGPEQPPELVVITARRYRCLPCGAVILVVPRGVHGRRVYSASAIGFALALWGLALSTAAEVRRRISPATIVGDAAVTSWVTLRRWARDVARRHLFPSTPDPGPGASLRRVAASAAAALAASAEPTTRALPLTHRAWLGAAHAG
jgi:ferredoxin